MREARHLAQLENKHCVRAEESKRFWDHAEAGEFANKPVVPTRSSYKTKKTKKV
jgi:hypothetical protein